MDNILKIATLNCNGLNEKKTLMIFDLSEKYNLDVIFLQETHFCSEKNIKDLEKYFGDKYNLFFPLSNNKTKGVGIII